MHAAAELLRGKADRSDDGFTIIELLVALAILTIVVVFSAQEMVSAVAVSSDSQKRIVASNVVANAMEHLRAQSATVAGFNSVPVQVNQAPVTTRVGGTLYTVTESTEWVVRGTNGSVCNNPGNSSLLLEATVAARWGTASVVASTTLLSPPNGSTNPANGALPVQVLTADSIGEGGAVVTATDLHTGHAYTSAPTGADGCAFFASLPPDTYKATVSVGSGGVDPTENQNPSQQEAVSAGTVGQPLTFQFQQGGTVSWSFSPDPGLSCAPATALCPASGMPISVADTPIGTALGYLYPTQRTNATTGTISPLFPNSAASYPSYRVFAGACTDADPLGVNSLGQSFYQNAPASTASVTSNGVVSASVPLYPIALAINDSSGQPVTNATSSTVTAVAGGSGLAQGGVCPSGAQPSPYQGPPTYGLSPVTAAGTTVTGVGLGHLAITVSVTVGTTTLTGSATVWVQPDGTYATNSDGSPGTKYPTGGIAAFPSASVVPVTVS
ncbi:prepilin-type N-terminal cleavage/methylation domain-containing protein [Acidiferrimicrobium sp. IK]|uniref:type IV pilus modification PilV family protein n=1 Tax=Acidiferrimicrobium sp. IK TaxID=2871700 RepID=UPI0021CB34C1|nr:prepilin-type N-terminal cleavage/methylation domain-containing protein [Acidiferrimicrobium sp. IK]MCU4184828.1 prepilin-type N-terminal cleavage/methylation domain-containing protein [Acidiferrimicrobium sp. IK]